VGVFYFSSHFSDADVAERIRNTIPKWRTAVAEFCESGINQGFAATIRAKYRARR